MSTPNFEKAVAMFTTLADGTTSFQLPDVDKGEAYAPYTDNSVIKLAFCSQQTVIEESSGTVTFRKRIRPVSENKTQLGSLGTNAKKLKYEQVTYSWDAPTMFDEAIGAYDQARGLSVSMADRLGIYSSEMITQVDANRVKAVEDAVQTANAQDFDFAAATADQVYLAVCALADKVLKIADTELVNIPRSSITIVLASDVFNKLMLAGKLGNYTQQVFTNGRFNTFQIGGFDVVPCYTLTKYKVVIGTKFSCVCGDKLVAANVGQIGNSNDLESYFEYTTLFGIMYPQTFYALTDKSGGATTVTPAIKTTVNYATKKSK